MAPTGFISLLTSEITSNAQILTEYMQENNIAQPSFEADSLPVSVPGSNEKISAARAALIDATKALHTLVVGPTETIKNSYFEELVLLGALHVLCHFNVPQNVPLEGTIAFSELASATGLQEPLLVRFLRMAAANYYFSESPPGVVTHTAGSKPLATDKGMRACIWMRYTEKLPALTRLVDMVEAYPETGEPQDIAYKLAFGDTFFDKMEKHTDCMIKFGQFVDARAQGDASQADSAESLAHAFPWRELPADSLVVDVGGGIGNISAAISREHPHLQFKVQDFAHLEAEAAALLESESESRGVSRVEFVPHDFFQAQPASGAAVYFLRNILHDWSDVHCKRILGPLVRAMAPTSSILVCDVVVPEPNVLSKTEESHIRATDLTMLMLVDGKERSLQDWEALFRSVDERLYIRAIVGRPRLKRDSLMELRLR